MSTIYRKPSPPRGRAHVYGESAQVEPAIDDSAVNIARLEARHRELLAKIFVLEAKVTDQERILYLPRGRHRFSPFERPFPQYNRVEILVDARAADKMEAQRVSLIAKGKLPFFSVTHESDRAAFFPSRFIWDESAGVMAEGSFTTHGRAFLCRGRPTFFSPTFCVGNLDLLPAQAVHRVMCGDLGGTANLGAFVAGNAAFGEKLKVCLSPEVAQDTGGGAKRGNEI